MHNPDDFTLSKDREERESGEKNTEMSLRVVQYYGSGRSNCREWAGND